MYFLILITSLTFPSTSNTIIGAEFKSAGFENLSECNALLLNIALRDNPEVKIKKSNDPTDHWSARVSFTNKVGTLVIKDYSCSFNGHITPNELKH